jgi:UDP-N-acetylmuramate--alanine ligase
MFTKPKHVHFVGVGGIGVSGLAKLMHELGVSVSGSDDAASGITDEVASFGIGVSIGHDAGNVPADCDLLVYSEAVPGENPERVEAAKRGIRRLAAAEFLGEYTKEMRTIAVSGTNGKSTTTAMIGLILERAGLDPTVIVGSKVPAFPLGNVRVGKSDLLVLEADEYRAKYLNYSPWMIVLTNIEEDHLDFYTGLPEIAETFDKYLTHLKPGGKVILNADDQVSTHELHSAVRPTTYGIAHEADRRATHISVAHGEQRFEVTDADSDLGEFVLKIPAKFNIENALAAISAALELDVPLETVREALAAFGGIWRRFEVVGQCNGATVVSDYGHHPTALRLTVAAAREFYPHRRIVLVFQPHQHNRTARFFEDFVSALHLPDLSIVSDIYHVKGREETSDISSRDLVASAGRPEAVVYGGNLDETKKLAISLVRPDDVVIVMGAGDIDELAREIVRCES